MKLLDPNDWDSIREHVEFQVDVEKDLIDSFTRADSSKLDRADLSCLPPGFIPMVLRIDPDQFKHKASGHTLFDLYVYEGRKVSGKHNVIVNATNSDWRAKKNDTAHLVRNGLVVAVEEAKKRQEIEENFNKSFADGGTVAGLKSLIEALPTIVVEGFKIEGVSILGFTGAIVFVAEDELLLIENGMRNQQGGIAKEGSFPTFESASIDLDEEGELDTSDMLRERMNLIDALGLPLDRSTEAISKEWGKQLEAGYNQWAKETRETLRNAGIIAIVPSFEDAINSQRAIKVEPLGSGGVGR